MYIGQCTSRHIAKIKTGERQRAPPPETYWWVGALESTVNMVPAKAYTININSTNGNSSIKADFSRKKLNSIKHFLVVFKNFSKFSNIKQYF